ncbi:EAL domain-containing protein [Leeia oryzae]|uniref:EAL domain-containing protein n=1 Tax=Leeia oryzae TaxID=356662 RepID=UPI0003821E66|nr:EAL domain-containing protein [Leeia oryzae]
MHPTPMPQDEFIRLEALRNLHVLDTMPEAAFDALVQTAATICGTPVSLVSLIDADRQWFKANKGLEGVTETPRDISFCTHAIGQQDIYEVQDALQNPLFANNPLVTQSPFIRFYAGAPIRLSNGAAVGTLCIIDQKPGHLTDQQKDLLRHLATVAASLLEGRRAMREQEQLLAERQQAEQALEQERQRLTYALDSARAGTWEWNPQTGETRFNAQWAHMLGMTLDEVLAMSSRAWDDLIHPDDMPHVITEIEKHLAGKTDTYQCEFRIHHKEGRWIWVLDQGQVMSWTPDGRPEWMYGIQQNITDRRHQEDALRKSQTFLDRTGRLASVGGWEFDAQSYELIWSDETCRLHGVEPGYQPILDEAIDFFEPKARPVFRQALENSLMTGEGWDLELPMLPINGKPMWARVVGSVEYDEDKRTRVVGAFQDVTDRVMQRQDIEEARDRIRLATDSGQIGIWEFDLATESVIWDHWVYRLFGVTEQPGMSADDHWRQRLHPDDLPKIEKEKFDAIAEGRDLDSEFRVIWPDGSLHHIRTRARSYRDAEGNIVRLIGANWDVTDLRQLASELATQHELLRVTLQSIADAVITTDVHQNIRWLNPVAEQLTGWSNQEAEGQPLDHVFKIANEKTRQPIANPVAICLAQGQQVGSSHHHAMLISRFGAEFGIEDSASPIRTESGDLLGVVLVFRDVTEQRRLSSEMTFRATHDPLTGLINRTEFESTLQQFLSRAQEEHSEHALMYIDLDQFKLVNDACGHAVGDLLLQQVSKLLEDTIRSRDILARLGGDEFAVILEYCPAEQAQRVAQQICDRMEKFRFIHDQHRFRIGTSIGLVPIDDRWLSIATLLQAADTSCYAAKEAGRNRVHVWFDSDQQLQSRHGEMQWATRIEQALDEDRFVLMAQRIEPLHCESQGIHAEVLLRLVDTDGKLILPGAFFPAAERFHLTSRIDRWVLAHALAWLRSVKHLDSIDMISVNLSGQSVGDRAFHHLANEMLHEAGPDLCKRLCFEITETAAITNLADAAHFIKHARSLNVRIALDDFGAGASSFGYLKMLTIDYLKIDGQFIRNLENDALDDVTVHCFVQVASTIGVKTVAEFVDKAATLSRLKEIGVDYAQGFLLHKPEPIHALLKPWKRPEV